MKPTPITSKFGYSLWHPKRDPPHMIRKNNPLLYSRSFVGSCYFKQSWKCFQVTTFIPLLTPRQAFSLVQIYLIMKKQQTMHEPKRWREAKGENGPGSKRLHLRVGEQAGKPRISPTKVLRWSGDCRQYIRYLDGGQPLAGLVTLLLWTTGSQEMAGRRLPTSNYLIDFRYRSIITLVLQRNVSKNSHEQIAIYCKS